MSKIGYFLGGALLGALGTAILAYIGDATQSAAASRSFEPLKGDWPAVDCGDAEERSEKTSPEEPGKTLERQSS